MFLSGRIVVHPHPLPKIRSKRFIERSGKQFVFAFQMRQSRTDWNRGRGLVVTHQVQHRLRFLGLRFSFVAFARTQVKDVVHDAEISDPHLFHLLIAMLVAEPLKPAFHKINCASRPVRRLADSQPQYAFAEDGCWLLIPARAKPPTDFSDFGNGREYWEPDHARGGITVPAGGRDRSPEGSWPALYFSELGSLRILSAALKVLRHVLGSP